MVLSSGRIGPRMNVLIPVIVALGIPGSVSASSLSRSIQFFRSCAFRLVFLSTYHGLFRACCARTLCPTKTERNAERDTIATARQFSTIYQKHPQTKSVCWSPMRMAEMRIIAVKIITIERHKVMSRTIFWRRLMWTFQSSCTGITMTVSR